MTIISHQRETTLTIVKILQIVKVFKDQEQRQKTSTVEWNKTKLPLCKRRARIVQNFCPFLVPHNVFWSLCPKLCRVVYRSGKCVAINLSTFGRVITCMDGTSNTSRRTQKTQIVLWNSCQMSEASIKRMHVICVSKVQCPSFTRKPSLFFQREIKNF